jgi:hypothetical protein
MASIFFTERLPGTSNISNCSAVPHLLFQVARIAQHLRCRPRPVFPSQRHTAASPFRATRRKREAAILALPMGTTGPDGLASSPPKPLANRFLTSFQLLSQPLPSLFLKSRVHAKLLMAPILERYQTINKAQGGAPSQPWASDGL